MTETTVFVTTVMVTEAVVILSETTVMVTETIITESGCNDCYGDAETTVKVTAMSIMVIKKVCHGVGD